MVRVRGQGVARSRLCLNICHGVRSATLGRQVSQWCARKIFRLLRFIQPAWCANLCVGSGKVIFFLLVRHSVLCETGDCCSVRARRPDHKPIHVSRADRSIHRIERAQEQRPHPASTSGQLPEPGSGGPIMRRPARTLHPQLDLRDI